MLNNIPMYRLILIRYVYIYGVKDSIIYYYRINA